MTDTQPYREKTAQYLRPHQVESMTEEANRLESTLNQPPYVANAIQNRADIMRSLNRIKKNLDDQTPRAYAQDQLDVAVRRERELREQWATGMPTQEEMRRAPAGAVDKHTAWERRNKAAILEWKNIRLRLLASGHYDSEVAGDATDIANVERYRPSGGAQQVNMHAEMIPGRLQFGPEPGAGPSTVLDASDLSVLRKADPELADSVALLSNEARARVAALVRSLRELEVQPQPEQPRRRKPAGNYRNTELAALRARAKELGINCWHKGKAQLREAIAEAERPQSQGPAAVPFMG